MADESFVTFLFHQPYFLRLRLRVAGLSPAPLLTQEGKSDITPLTPQKT